MSKVKEIKDRENFMLGGKLSELDWEPKTEEQVSQELFKGLDPDKIVDAFEEQTGLKTKTVEIPNQIYKFVYLSPCTDEDDGELLKKLYNNPKQYQICQRQDNWTPRGELKIFIEYLENIDVRLEKEAEKVEQPQE